jgi:hypothetical protein
VNFFIQDGDLMLVINPFHFMSDIARSCIRSEKIIGPGCVFVLCLLVDFFRKIRTKLERRNPGKIMILEAI